MFNLVLKDILVQKKMVLGCFLYVVFFIFAMQGVAGLVLYPTALTAITYMLVLTACACDDKNKADVLLNSLPLKRSSIVLAKYLSIFAYMVIGTVAYIITTNIFSLTGFPVKALPITLEGLAGGLFAIVVIHSVYFPFFFKFGYNKSRFVNLILFFSFFFGITSSINFLYINRDKAWVQGLEGFITSQSQIQLFVFMMVVLALILAISYVISLRIYRHREF